MRLSEFQYSLPKGLIAQRPLSERDTSRLMVVDRIAGTVDEKTFSDILSFLDPGDCLVVNDTKVVPVRFYGRRESGGQVEIFLLDTRGEKLTALVNPSKRIRDGEIILVSDKIEVRVLGKSGPARIVEFDRPLEEALKYGHIPLPPYIEREDVPSDRKDYQTVYAEKEGASAAPTAGLHFTDELIKRISVKGVNIARITLHTGYGTFAPVKTEHIEDHQMHSEYFEITKAAADIINSTKDKGGRIVAVGTTSTRALESAAEPEAGRVKPFSGRTNLFIYPGYKFKIVSRMITNFHLPGSTLLMLVSAFAGRDLILRAYKEAVEREFRFFSYGDAMLIV
ncbi:MAG: tRNA preQ1(34) S-adenosylmethionine ribosyltransferase-isomerase QueA [Candidatus Omnitrophica bacterium]|nr:tRNA preQ1(34) S-adenosylmethionine ribosyltransferase-isomerase QueA [Candidatus Omnitrophota bacterium]MDD5488908.1 tRNA preQ1(34) S-adenosylmethionine ribosyltransferase-isomerase QueA [Candidatus Omnitrophota bacterium]